MAIERTCPKCGSIILIAVEVQNPKSVPRAEPEVKKV